MLGSGSSIEFRFAEAQGAALVTKYPTYRENVQGIGKFEKFAKENYASWVEFAHDAGHGDVSPVLVTGVDRTKDFAMMCYSDYIGGINPCVFKTLAIASASAWAWGIWESSRPIYENHGPQLCRPPATRITDLTPSDNGRAEPTPDEYNQCVFIRYFSGRDRRLRVPKFMKAGAGPHNLDAGSHNDEGSPLQARSGSASGSNTSFSSSDVGWNNDTGSVTSIDSEPDSVTHNPTTVRFYPPLHYSHSD